MSKTINKRIVNDCYTIETISTNGGTFMILEKMALYEGNQKKDLPICEYISSWEDYEPSLEEINHQITIYNDSRWNTFSNQEDTWEIVEITYYGVSPFKMLNYDETTGYFEIEKPDPNNEGQLIRWAFWQNQGKYFTGHPNAFLKNKKIIFMNTQGG